MDYQYTTAETETEHSERAGADEETTTSYYCATCAAHFPAALDCGHDATERSAVKAEPMICSCGSKTCGAIVTFGLPVSVFHPVIEPIPSQYERDRLAREIRSSALAGVEP